LTTAIGGNFNALEWAALNHIANQYPDHKNGLITAFSSCSVVKRENTGMGFYTDFEVNGQAEMPDGMRTPLGDAWLSIDGMKVGVCCLVHLKKGIPAILEGYSPAGENTSGIIVIPFKNGTR
jgi:hypothetical protein